MSLTPEHSLEITPGAQRRIAVLLTQEKPGSYLRISVEGGGCSGFQYKFDFTNEPITEEDASFGEEGGKVVIDTTSLGFIKGSVVDYVVTLGSAEFQITNPNATAKCGCGNSFSVM
ncbi:MAG: iron-sulfur cluster assembly accessory protein [Alphaproteobacteria bacterium]|nr:iron-sulfur cluster assembly accessory protein [Alphaproteobacteria bacterium]